MTVPECGTGRLVLAAAGALTTAAALGVLSALVVWRAVVERRIR